MAVGWAGDGPAVAQRSLHIPQTTLKILSICNLWFHTWKPESGVTTNFFTHKILSFRAYKSGIPQTACRGVLTAVWELNTSRPRFNYTDSTFCSHRSWTKQRRFPRTGLTNPFLRINVPTARYELHRVTSWKYSLHHDVLLTSWPHRIICLEWTGVKMAGTWNWPFPYTEEVNTAWVITITLPKALNL